MIEIEASLSQESQDRYLTYALSVVTGRALPDVRDGLKPVQRRILYAMASNLKLRPTGNHRKSAAVVGEVLARYHPHGDVACYDAMVRMAQDFSLRYPLVDGQGNFGSLDGDSPAAYRYTEAKLRPIALEVLGEIEEGTVNFKANFDATVIEPEVLPSRVPQLLMNGATGIAVGMATNIPPHNISELLKALLALLDDPEISTKKLVSIIPAPDFPTGCLIINSKEEMEEIYRTGRGSVRMRSEWKLETLSRGKQAIVISSMPFAVNKSLLVTRIAELIIARKVPQLIDVRDESTDQVRIVLELAAGADPDLAIAYLYKNTPLESPFAVNMTAITPSGRPELLSLKQCLQHFLDFREEVVEKRLRFERLNLEERIHILLGLVKIYDALDEALKIIRSSSGRQDAAEKLIKRFDLTEIQGYAVVDMRIYQLSKTSITEIRDELAKKQARIKEIDKILKSRDKLLDLVRLDIKEISKNFGDARISKIIKGVVETELSAEDFIVEEDVFAIVTKDGWLKRIRQSNDLSTTRLREGDSILSAAALTTLDSVAFFTNLGYLYILPVSEFPSSSGYGSPIQKLLKFKDGERIVKTFAVKKKKGEQGLLLNEDTSNHLVEGQSVAMVSARGMGYLLLLEGLEDIRKNGKKIMKLREGDLLVTVEPSAKKFALITKQAYGVVIKESDLPARNQPAIGVILQSVGKDDEVVALLGISKQINLKLSNDKEKVIDFSSIPDGRRGIKGKKIVSKVEIISATSLR